MQWPCKPGSQYPGVLATAGLSLGSAAFDAVRPRQVGGGAGAVVLNLSAKLGAESPRGLRQPLRLVAQLFEVPDEGLILSRCGWHAVW